ncbi:DUF983 domain-containing protein [Sphingosinicella rhizophila]|uniref:DUF983 domain-containing protein n=1 Tax=Sphingosinicella rhizophila TaxID=3050082 RepID=A0ABU3Q7M1_9SPHN|nr:DUF983 domain-containing protein [Sphingosinicella sp. GR2756]MDT9599396.1 DUF983 domain-containing protein [Sphingosinicella sp. GR2756]
MTAEPSPQQVALGGLCPRCAARSLFQGLATFAPKCRACGLDFTSFNVGDGPAAFLTLIVGALITGLAIAVELGLHPPFWVHILLWIPITAAAVIGSLRLAKALLLALEYRNRAREGRIRADE